MENNDKNKTIINGSGHTINLNYSATDKSTIDLIDMMKKDQESNKELIGVAANAVKEVVTAITSSIKKGDTSKKILKKKKKSKK